MTDLLTVTGDGSPPSLPPFSGGCFDLLLEDGIFAARKTAYRRFFAGPKSRDVLFSGNNNTTTNQYQVIVADGVSKTLTYNLNRNLVQDDKYSYEYDAKNQCVAINEIGGTHRTEFTFDGYGRRVRIVEKNNGVVTSDKSFVFVGLAIAEERDVNGNVVKQFFDQGFKILSGPNTGVYFYTRNHRADIIEVTDSTGTVRARYEYSPYGIRTKVSGDLDADFGFTGYYHYQPSWMAQAHLLSWARIYRPNYARFTTPDPIGLAGGLNDLIYCENDPVNCVDLLGLEIAVQDHEVIGGKYHSLIRITPENQTHWAKHPKFVNKDENGKVYLTLGAGSVRGLLQSDLNRPTDIGQHPNSTPLKLPSRCKDEDEMISKLLKLDRNYKDDKNYDPFPAMNDETYNSNSYISGLLGAAGYVKPEMPREVPGWEKPLPKESFK